SGVGKSTLLGALCPTEEIETGNISEATGKGRHVTTAATLYDLPRGGVLVDTPGYRQFGILDVPKAQLALYFRELEPHVSRCRFKDCVHIQEPGCGVLAALENGEISDLRYSGYLQILGSLDED
ncbi:MAG: ribosome small subunit-dependent GTPase A, partial [Planctomycetota bacterium]